MKVIVFTMAFNAEKTIARTIDSILGQTFGDLDYYILDNGATDHTRDIILKYAKLDKRVKLIRLNKNDITNGGAIFHVLVTASNADYIVWCDADDTYSPEFLEKTVRFAQQESLDLVACGYDRIDGTSGAIIKHRTLSEHLIIEGDRFTEDFIQYRGFSAFLWGKLYSISFLRTAKTTGTIAAHHLCCDSAWVLNQFAKADRVGIYGEALYQYYQYPHSISRTRVKENQKSFEILWTTTKEYLEYYGPISKVNEDFLYAIYLSLMDEASGYIFESSLEAGEKLELLRQLFHGPRWAETLARQADPQFRNLAARGKFVQQMKERILSLASTPEEQHLAAEAIRELDKPRLAKRSVFE